MGSHGTNFHKRVADDLRLLCRIGVVSAGEPPVLVVMNPAAGSDVDPTEVSIAVRRDLDCRITTTRGAGDARRAAREAARAGVSMVVAAGGDGTIREVVEGLVDAKLDPDHTPVLGILPLGTGNDLARALGVPLRLTAAVEALAAVGAPRPLDLVRVEIDEDAGWAVNAVVIGNGGRIGAVLDDEAKAFWGPLSYLRSAVEVAFELEPMPVTVAIDGAPPAELDVLNVVAANGVSAGGGMAIAPGASPHDGRLDLVIVTACELSEVARIGTALLRGGDPDSEAYRRRTITRATIERRDGDALPVSVDGEIVDARAVAVEVVAARLRVAVPG